MPFKTILSITATLLTFVAFYPYILSIYQGKVKPHVFSWIIWGATTVIVFFAQYEAKGGVGAIPIGISGVITLCIAYLSYLKSDDIIITKLDWIFLLIAFSSLPFWYFSSNPLTAVIILTTVDLAGFGPTIRKAYYQPLEENIGFFSLFAFRNGLVVMAMETVSITTVLFPVAIGLACVLLIVLLLIRRSKLNQKASD